MPIFIGPYETMSIQMVLEGIAVDRPQTHDLLKSTIDKLGGTVPLDESGELFPPGETPQARAGRGEVFEIRIAVGQGAARRLFEARGRPIEDGKTGGGVLVLRRVSEG